MTFLYMSAKDSAQLENERKSTRELIQDARVAELEGVRATERLRIATEQYRERLGRPKETR